MIVSTAKVVIPIAIEVSDAGQPTPSVCCASEPYFRMRELAVRSSVGLGKGSGTPFINIKFRIRPFCAGSRVKQLTDTPIEVRTQLERFLVMKKAILALATVATIAVTALAIPSPAEAGWRGGGGAVAGVRVLRAG